MEEVPVSTDIESRTAYVDSARTVLALWVPGRSRTKGSLKPISRPGQRVRLIEDHRHSAPWREAIRRALVKEVLARYGRGWVPIAYPVLVDTIFHFERLGPVAQTMAYPCVNAGVNANGDEDKLRRNVLDALEGSGVLANDCWVVGSVTAGPRKVWAGEYGAGVQITVQEAP